MYYLWWGPGFVLLLQLFIVHWQNMHWTNVIIRSCIIEDYAVGCDCCLKGNDQPQINGCGQTSVITRVCWKVLKLGQKRNLDIMYWVVAAISFRIISLGTYVATPFFPSFRSTVEVIFLHAVWYCLQFPLDVTLSKHCPFSFTFNLGNKAILEIKVGS